MARRQRLDGRPAREPRLVARDHAGHLGLLEHDLRDEDRVGVAGAPPRQVAALARVPAQQQRGAIGGHRGEVQRTVRRAARPRCCSKAQVSLSSLLGPAPCLPGCHRAASPLSSPLAAAGRPCRASRREPPRPGRPRARTGPAMPPSQPGHQLPPRERHLVAPAAHCGSGGRATPPSGSASAACTPPRGRSSRSAPRPTARAARATTRPGTRSCRRPRSSWASRSARATPCRPASTVSGRSVKLFIPDRTRGTSFTKQLDVAQVDVSPPNGSSRPRPRAATTAPATHCRWRTFGTTTFGSVKATSATGYTGTISDPAWSAVAITLSSTRARRLRFTTRPGGRHAVPANLSPAGDAFTVTLQQPRPDRGLTGAARV